MTSEREARAAVRRIAARHIVDRRLLELENRIEALQERIAELERENEALREDAEKWRKHKEATEW